QTFPLAPSYPRLARRQSGFVHIGMENQVEILWVGWGMLRLPMGELNLAPRLPGGPLRASLLVGTVIALAACSRPTGPIAVGLAGVRGGRDAYPDDFTVRVESRPVGDESVRVPRVPERPATRARARPFCLANARRQTSRHHLPQQRLWTRGAPDVRGRVCAPGGDRARVRSLHPGHRVARAVPLAHAPRGRGRAAARRR